MALQKSIESDSGADATYWKISIADIEAARHTARITIEGFKDKEARTGGKRALTTKMFSIDGDAYAKAVMDAGGILTGLYDCLKQDDFFAGSTDV